MVVRTARESCPGQLARTATWWPLAVSVTTLMVGVPARSRWRARCSPESPTVAPGR